MDILAFTCLSFSLKWLSLSLIANSFKDVNDLGDHPDDDEFDDSLSSAATDTLSELSDGTLHYEPKVESLKDKKLNRIAEQMLAGLSQDSASKTGDSEPRVPDPDVSEKKSKDLVAMGDQLKIMMEKAQRLHDSKRDTRPLPQQELPAHVAWIFMSYCFFKLCAWMLCIIYVPIYIYIYYTHIYTYIYTYMAWICKHINAYTCFQTEVLETLKTLGDAPKPFPQSAQYKNNSKGESRGPDPDEAELEAGKPCKPKSKSTRKRRPDVKSAKVKKGDAKAAAASGENTSDPWIYSQIKREFIKSMVSSGVLKGQAVEAWNQSSQKRNFLSTVSVSELKRRRFIEKGCDHNPWAN